MVAQPQLGLYLAYISPTSRLYLACISRPGTFYYAFAVACFVLLFWSAPINAIVFASLFVGDGVADPIGRLITSWLAAPRCVRG